MKKSITLSLFAVGAIIILSTPFSQGVLFTQEVFHDISIREDLSIKNSDSNFLYQYGSGIEYQDTIGDGTYYKKVGIAWAGPEYEINNICFRLNHVSGSGTYSIQAQIFSDMFDGLDLKWSSAMYSSTDLPQGAGNQDWFCFYGPSFTLSYGDKIQLNQPWGSGRYVIIEDGGADTPDFTSAHYHTSWYAYYYPVPQFYVDYWFAIEDETTTKIFGNVLNQNNSIPLEDAYVLLLQNGLVLDTTLTNDAGYYEFPSLNPGAYSLAIYKDGFNSRTYVNVEVSEGEQVQQNAELSEPQIDLIVDGIDVLQVVDTDYMIAKKPSVIRIHSHLDGGEKISDVSGSLHVVGPNTDQIFNFENKEVKKTYSNIEIAYGDEAIEIYYTPTEQGDYKFTVNLDSNSISDINLENNSVAVGKTFYDVNDPKITIIPIITPTTSVDEEILLSSYKLAEKTFPFSSDVDFDVDSSHPLVLDYDFINSTFANDSLLKLYWSKLKYYNNSNYLTAVTSSEALIGSDVGTGFSSPAFPVGISSYEEANIYSVQNIFAHELYHLMGHPIIEEYNSYPPRGLFIDKNEKPFDVKKKIPAYNWLEFSTNIIDAGKIRRSIRGISPIESEFGYDMSWIRKYSYDLLALKQIYLSSGVKRINKSTAGDYFVFSGIVDSDENITNQPIYHLSGEYISTQNNEEGLYTFEMYDNSQNLLQSIQFSPSKSTGSSEDEIYSIIVPGDPLFNSYKIIKDGVELFNQSISQNEPSVQVISPNGGENFNSGNINITWQATDLDSDDLSYEVLLSKDNGVIYKPLSVGYSGTSINIDSDKLSGCNNSCLIKVIANDGFNESEDVSDMTFSIAKKMPNIFITSPADNTDFTINDETILEGSAYDLEDGALDGGLLNWSSDVDGFLGSGEYLVTNLSKGLHIITL